MTTTPEGFTVERCRTETCKAPIIWARTTNAKTGKSGTMPVDAEPVAGGNVRLYSRQGIVWAEVVPSQVTPADLFVSSGSDAYPPFPMPEETLPAPTEPLRTSHFVTCQRAADWRKPR
jgi:hypothetical protein